MVVNEEDVVNIMGGMEHAGGIKLNDHKRKLKNRCSTIYNHLSPHKYPPFFRFEICKKLGQGTYGKVQLGINKETGQRVRFNLVKSQKVKMR